MRIVMEQAGLTFWPALSLVIFFGTTLGVLFWIYRPGSSEFYKKLGDLALEKAFEQGSPSQTRTIQEMVVGESRPPPSKTSPEE
jgi:hypothetical protein